MSSIPISLGILKRWKAFCLFFVSHVVGDNLVSRLWDKRERFIFALAPGSEPTIFQLVPSCPYMSGQARTLGNACTNRYYPHWGHEHYIGARFTCKSAQAWFFFFACIGAKEDSDTNFELVFYYSRSTRRLTRARNASSATSVLIPPSRSAIWNLTCSFIPIRNLTR